MSFMYNRFTVYRRPISRMEYRIVNGRMVGLPKKGMHSFSRDSKRAKKNTKEIAYSTSYII